MNRRSFIGSILALGAAPAIVRAESLMRVRQIVTLPAGGVFFNGRIWTFEDQAVSYSEVLDAGAFQRQMDRQVDHLITQMSDDMYNHPNNKLTFMSAQMREILGLRE